MKTKITLLLLLVCCTFYGQIPSINPTFKGNNFKSVPDIKQVKLHDSVMKFSNNDLRNKTAEEFVAESAGSSDDFTKLLKRVVEGSLSISDYTFYNNSYNLKIDAYKAKISRFKMERSEKIDITEIEELMDSIISVRKDIEEARSFVKLLRIKKNQKLGWFPSWNKNNKDDFFQEFYDEDSNHTNYLNNFSIIFASTTVQSELLSDYAGPFRFSFGTVINAESNNETEDSETEGEPNEQEQEDDLKRLINGGGNFYLNTLLPIHSYNSNNFIELSSFNLRVASDIEGVGDDVETSNVKYGANFSSYLALTTDKKKFNFFINAEYGWISGSNNFRDDFGLQKVFDKPAFIGKAIIGVMLDNKVTITITSKSISNYNSLLSDKIMVGVQLLN